MVPTIFDYLDSYRKNGSVNLDAALRAFDIPNTDTAKRRLLEAHEYLIIDAFAFAHQSIPAFMREYQQERTVAASVEYALREAAQHALYCGRSVNHSLSESYRVAAYMIECARQNLDSPRRRGESWSKRITRLTAGMGLSEDELRRLIEFLPHHSPEEFMAMPYVGDDCLRKCINSYLTMPEDWSDGLHIFPDVVFEEVPQWKFENYIKDTQTKDTLLIAAKELGRRTHKFCVAKKCGYTLCAAAYSEVNHGDELYFQTDRDHFVSVDLLLTSGKSYDEAQREGLLNWIHSQESQPVALPVHMLVRGGCVDDAIGWGYCKSIAVDLRSEDLHFLTHPSHMQ